MFLSFIKCLYIKRNGVCAIYAFSLLAGFQRRISDLSVKLTEPYCQKEKFGYESVNQISK